MRTLLKTPYLRGNPLIIAVVVLFAILDEIRGAFKINLGQCPWWFKKYYLGMIWFQFDCIEDPNWRSTRREALHLWAFHAVYWKLESLYHRTLISWMTYKRLGHWGYLPVAGGVTRSSPMSGLFYRNNHGSFPVISDSFFTTGNIFFVDAGTDTGGTTSGFGQHPDRAVTDIDSAHNLCTASQGDTLIVLTGHVENVASASDITFDVAGISLIGLGHGAARPLLTYTETDGDITISAASVLLKNIVLTSTKNEVVVLIKSSASDLTLDAVDVKDPGNTFEIIQFLLTTNASDNLVIKNCKHNTSTVSASAQLWIRLIGTDATHIHDNVFTLVLADAATSATISGDASVRACIIQRNVILQTCGSTAVSGILFTDGAVVFTTDNRVAAIDVGTIGLVNDVGSAGFSAETYALDTADKSGILVPGVDA